MRTPRDLLSDWSVGLANGSALRRGMIYFKEWTLISHDIGPLSVWLLILCAVFPSSGRMNEEISVC
jgi:hypothetical protein